jgi:hypothetical protein
MDEFLRMYIWEYYFWGYCICGQTYADKFLSLFIRELNFWGCCICGQTYADQFLSSFIWELNFWGCCICGRHSQVHPVRFTDVSVSVHPVPNASCGKKGLYNSEFGTGCTITLTAVNQTGCTLTLTSMNRTGCTCECRPQMQHSQKLSSHINKLKNWSANAISSKIISSNIHP